MTKPAKVEFTGRIDGQPVVRMYKEIQVPMTLEEAHELINNGKVPFIYAETGECPECHFKFTGAKWQAEVFGYPHRVNCRFSIAAKIVSGGVERIDPQ